VAWSVVTLLMLIDPLFAARLSAVKDFAAMFRSSSSPQGKSG
jgi:hypothetical protein